MTCKWSIWGSTGAMSLDLVVPTWKNSKLTWPKVLLWCSWFHDHQLYQEWLEKGSIFEWRLVMWPTVARIGSSWAIGIVGFQSWPPNSYEFFALYSFLQKSSGSMEPLEPPLTPALKFMEVLQGVEYFSYSAHQFGWIE